MLRVPDVQNATPYYLRRARVLTRRPIPDCTLGEHRWHSEKQDECQDGDVFLQTCRCGARRSIFILFESDYVERVEAGAWS
jgi:hypothetical protein